MGRKDAGPLLRVADLPYDQAKKAHLNKGGLFWLGHMSVMSVRIKGKSGFTPTEVVVAILLLSILLAVGIPTSSKWLPDIRLKSAVRNLKSDVEMAKLRAIRENASVALVFNTASNTYTVFVDDGGVGGGADNWIQDGTEQLLKDVTMPQDVNMYEASFTGGVARCRFDGRGLPNVSSGHVYMKNARNNYRGITLSRVGHVQIKKKTQGTGWVDE